MPVLEAAAVHDEEKGELSIFAVNRDQKGELELSCDLRSFETLTGATHTVLDSRDAKAVNTHNAQNVKPREASGAKLEKGRLSVRLPSLSWNVLRLSTRK